MEPGPVMNTATLDLFPFSHLEASKMDGGLSEALFWVCDWQQWAYEVEHFRSVGS